MSNLSDDESLYSYSAAATVDNSDIIPVTEASTAESDDGEFEPTVDMIIDDFDDEKTIAEEERIALVENASCQQEEVESLQKESEMPLDEVLKCYNDTKRDLVEEEEGSEAEFEPTVDMMVHDFDDEKTIEEEENRALEDKESILEEVESLQKESEIPLEELRKMYSEPQPESSRPRKKKSSLDSAMRRSKKARKLAAAAAVLPREASEDENAVEPASLSTEDIPDTHSEEDTNLLAIIADGEIVDEEEDGEYVPEDETADNQDPEEDDTTKEKIGTDHQANIPDGLCKYDDVLPYNNEDKLVWCPFTIDEKHVEKYLDEYREIDKIQQQQLENEKNLKESEEKKSKEGESLKDSKHLPTSKKPDMMDVVQLTYDSPKQQNLRSSTAQNLKDDEQALYLLLQCGFNFAEALRRKKVSNGVCCSFPFSSPMSSWSEGECSGFESGMRTYGKNFYNIAKAKCRTRSVSEICQFYYRWKKTTRYDTFVSQNGNGSIEDKKIVNNFKKNNSSVTDHMDKFLDDDSSASNTLQLNINIGESFDKTLSLRKRRGSSTSSEGSDRSKRLEGSRTSGRTTLLPKK